MRRINVGGYYCNMWWGDSPYENTAEEDCASTAPAKSFPQSGYVLYNVSRNVWNWCNDWFSDNRDLEDTNYNLKGPNSGIRKIIRDGSHLCHSAVKKMVETVHFIGRNHYFQYGGK